MADKKKRATKVLVGVIDEAPIGGEQNRPVKVKLFILDGKQWVWVNFWTPAGKHSIASICAAALPVIVTMTVTMSRSECHCSALLTALHCTSRQRPHVAHISMNADSSGMAHTQHVEVFSLFAVLPRKSYIHSIAPTLLATVHCVAGNYGSRDIQADVNAPHMPYKLKRDSTCGSYFYRKATAIFPTVADGTLQDGSSQLCAIVDGDQELSIDR